MKKIYAAAIAVPLILAGGAVKTLDLSFPREVQIAGDEKSDYVIVRPEGCEFSVTSACANLSRAIKKETGVELKSVTDKTDRYEAGAKKASEILFADTNRNIVCPSGHTVKYDDFTVCMNDRDLVVTAQNGDGYAAAVDYIKTEFLQDGKFSVPKGLCYHHSGEYEISEIKLLSKDISEYSVVYTSPASEGNAREFSELVREKTGIITPISDTASGSSIVFLCAGDMPKTDYKIEEKDGSIYISASGATALNKACAEFRDMIFATEEKTVTVEKIDLSGKIEKRSEHSDYISVRDGLANTKKKLTEDKKLTVAYFGGSVTVGHASTDREQFSWRARTTKWLADNFPEAEVVEINSAIGATGSHLGAFRVQRDIIAHKPDLVFVEFSINDCYNGETEGSAGENYEAIVRSIRSALPDCDIVSIYITDSGRASGGGDFAIKTAHDKVAAAYGVDAVDVGKALIKKYFLRGTASSDWSKYFTDIVHMNDTGFAEYADILAEYLENNLLFDNGKAVADHALPEKVNAGADRQLSYILATEEMLDGAKGFTFEKGTFENGTVPKYEGYLKTSTADNSITITFTGTELSLFMSGYTSGTVTYEVDGKKWRADRNSMNNPFPIVKNLEYGEHTITMTFGFKDSTYANIGAFLVR